MLVLFFVPRVSRAALGKYTAAALYPGHIPAAPRKSHDKPARPET
jgi:hypothetical protein